MKKGALYAFIAYVMWGVFPLYFKALHAVPSFQITAHRVVWSFLFLMLLVTLRHELPGLKQVITPRIAGIYLIAGTILACNWGTYVWAVNAGYIVESSLGYFINPLVSVLLGVIFLKEKLRPTQWLPILIAAGGVIYLTVSYGSLPWISLALAISFGLYGLMKKIAPLGSLYGLTTETMMIFIPALIFLLFNEFNGTGAFIHAGWLNSMLLVLTGVVTAVPLLFFATGARNVSLTTLGLLQYVSPTIQFFIGVFLFGEPFTHTRLIGFGIIWFALILFSAESLLVRRKAAVEALPVTAE